MRAAAPVLVLAVMLTLAGCSSAAPASAPVATTTEAPAVTSAPAQPTTVDGLYLTVLRKRGIGSSDDEREIRRGRAVCQLLQSGSTYPEVIDALMTNGFTASEAGFVSGLAVSAYCPDQKSKLHA